MSVQYIVVNGFRSSGTKSMAAETSTPFGREASAVRGLQLKQAVLSIIFSSIFLVLRAAGEDFYVYL